MSIPLHFLLRIASMVTVMVVWRLTSGQGSWQGIVFSAGFAHYALSLIYARTQIREVMGHQRTLMACGVLAAGAAALYLGQFSLLLYFAVHHAFNEVYLLQRVVQPGDAAEGKALRTSSIVLHVLLYLSLLRSSAVLDIVPDPLLLAGLLLAYVVFFRLLWRLHATLTMPELIDLCAFEIAGLLLLVASFFVHVGFLQIVLYHFVFWALFPLAKLAKRGSGAVGRYIGLNVFLTALFLLLSPLALTPFHFLPTTWSEQFRVWSYLHITFSFALSRAHPGWITRWFQSPPAPAPAL